MSRILVLAAHPDDEVLGCGGTIARRAAEGHQLSIVILGEGVTSRHARREDADRAELEALHGDARRAASLLGVEELRILDLPDNRFDSLPLLEVVQRIERQIRELRPEIVYTHHGGDLNVDHSVVHRASLIATRPMADCPVREVYCYEVASSTEWAFEEIEGSFRPDSFVEITKTLPTKLEAMAAYRGEARDWPHPRSARALEAQARRWGAVVGVDAAEAFRSVRTVDRERETA